MSKCSIEITVTGENTNIVIKNPSGKKDEPSFAVAVLMFTLFKIMPTVFYLDSPERRVNDD